MSKVESKFATAYVQESYSDAALKRAWSKYSFNYKIDGEARHTWYDSNTSEVGFDDGKGAEELFNLTEEIDRVIRESHSKADIDVLDLREFACKHLRAMIKVEQELQRAPASERCYKASNVKPMDMDKLSLEEQCVLEVLQEQLEKAESEGAVGEGAPGEKVYTITKEMVDAKMQGKEQQPN
jgi:hypothetical protein